jgi:hypothetical protein
MENIMSIVELRESILLLEIKKSNDLRLLKEQFKITYESLKPVNLMKNKINDLIESPDLKETLLNTTLSLAAGYLSKKAIVGSTHNPLKQLLGMVLQIGVSSMVAKNTDEIKSTALNLLNKFISKRNY